MVRGTLPCAVKVLRLFAAVALRNAPRGNFLTIHLDSWGPSPYALDAVERDGAKVETKFIEKKR